MRTNRKPSTGSSTRRRASRRGWIAAPLLVALLVLLPVASAQAVSYSAGTALPAAGKTASVAVNQSSGDVYVASAGPEGVNLGGAGTILRFNSAGTELTCTLSPPPVHPIGLGVDPTTGKLYSVELGATEPTNAGKLRTYPSGCGTEAAVTTGTANATTGNTELTSVATSHPLQPRQWIAGTGIPSGNATGKLDATTNKVTEVTGASGTFVAGQTLYPTSQKIVNCVPDCTSPISAPTEIELSGEAKIGSAPKAIPIMARTTVESFSEGTATAILSNKLEASGSVSISGSAWSIETASAAPLGQPGIDSSGNILWPNRTGSKLQKFAPWGKEAVEGGFPVTTVTGPLGVKRTSSAALDAKNDVYVVSSGEGNTLSCTNPVAGRLLKLQPDGTGAAIFPASVTEYVTTVAVDKRTGNVYVGRGCQALASHGFEVEVYGPGGGLLAKEIGKGLFATAGTVAPGPSLFNQLAFDEANRKLYAVDPGHGSVQVFNDTSAQKTLATSVSPSGAGEVKCNGTGNACLAQYDEGQEVIAEAVPAAGKEFKEWASGTGSATTCNASTSASCTFTLSANSTIEAVFKNEGPPMFKLNLSTSGNGSGTFTCKVNSGTEEPCLAEYEEGKSVEVIPHPATGSQFAHWTGACSGSGTCVVAMTTERSVGAEFTLESRSLTITPTGNGSGTVSCEDNGSAASCAGPFLFGHTIKVHAVANAGSTLDTLTGTGSAAGHCTLGTGICEFTITANSGVTAEFNLESHSLTISEPGGGTGTVACEDNGSAASCAGPFLHGHTIKVVATATGTSTLGELTGTGSAAGHCNLANSTSGSCEFTITEDSGVTAKFLAAGTATLKVFKGGNGQGTISSTPPGISCGTEPCQATFSAGEEVELLAAPASGSVFGGWIGCQPISGEIVKCKVKVTAPQAEVTAIFLTEGQAGQGVTVTTEPAGANCANGGVKVVSASGTSYVCNGAPGSNGAPGQSVTVTTESPGANCINGGVKVVSSAGTTYVCNGAAGTPGQGVTVTAESPGGNCANGGVRLVSVSGISFICNGAPGPSGAVGAQGATGPSGSTGQTGAQGPKGDTGAQGAQGAKGSRGPAGKVTVTCKATGSSKVVCTVKQPKASSSKSLLTWLVRKGGRAVKHGRTSALRLQRVLNHLPAGRYVLHVDGQRKPIVIEVG